MANKILLTGATGFIGYNIATTLLDNGYAVRMLVREPVLNRLKHKNAEFIIGDIRNYDDVWKAIDGCDIVIHTAGLFTFDNSRRDEIYEVNVKGTENICKAIVENRAIQRFVYTSSAATIGKAHHALSDENTNFNLWKISSHYKKSKVLAENVVWKYHEQDNIPAIILNPSLPLGYYDIRPTSTGMMVKSFLRATKKVYINGGFNFVHVDDVAKAHVLAITTGRIGERYIIGGTNLTLKEFYQKLQKYKQSTKIVKVPYYVALLGAWLNVVFRTLLKRKQPSITPRGVQLSRKKMFYDTTKSQKELGIRYTPIDKAIHDSVEWFSINEK